MATPFFSNPKKISLFALAISFSFLKFCIWEFDTLVITAILGLAILVNSLISPILFIPNSRTQKLKSWGNLDNVKESPIKLLLFPNVLWVLPNWLSALDNILLVLVFPLLPVIPIVIPLNLFLANLPIFISASFVSSTYNPLYFLAILIFDTNTPHAPREIADSMNLWPSKFSPIRAINNSPFLIVLSSILIPWILSKLFRKFEVGSDALQAAIKSCFVHNGISQLPSYFQYSW